MTAVTVEQPLDPANVEGLLHAMLTGRTTDRVRAFGLALTGGYGGMTVVDSQCVIAGRPLVLTLQQLWRHLVEFDSAIIVARRGGIRLHTPSNVHLEALDSADGYGPAYGAGPR